MDAMKTALTSTTKMITSKNGVRGTAIVAFIAALVAILIGSKRVDEAKKEEKEDKWGAAMAGIGTIVAFVSLVVGFYAGRVSKKLGGSSVKIMGFDTDDFAERVKAAAEKLRESIMRAKKSSGSSASLDAPGSSCAMNGDHAESASMLAARASARISSFLAQQM